VTTTTAVPNAASAERTRSRSTGLAALSPLVMGIAFVTYAVHEGLPPVDALRAAVAVALTQVLPGALAWRAVRPRRGSRLEDLAMGFAIGSVFAIGTQVVAGLAGVAALSWLLPLVLVLALLAAPAVRHRIVSAQTTPLPVWWAPAVSAVAAFSAPQTVGYFRQLPLSWSSGYRAPHVDAYLHLALAGELAHRGPVTFPWVQSEPLGYHWFAHAWIAQVGMSAGVPLDGVVFRFMPAIMPIVVVLAVATAAVRLTGRAWAGPVAAVITLVGGDVNYFGKLTPGFPVAPLSPTLALGAPILLAIVVVLFLRWRHELLPGGLLLLPVLGVGAAGTKGSTAPLIVVGLGLALFAALLFDRKRVLQLGVDLAIMFGCLLFALVVVFRGSGAGLHLSLVDAASQTQGAAWLGGVHSASSRAFVIILAVFAVFGRGLLVTALLFTKAGRRNPVTWLLLGAGLTGSLAVGIFAHPGLSQYYFARSAGPLLALGSTVAIATLVDRYGRQLTAPVVVGLGAGVIMAVLPDALVGPLIRSHIRTAVAMLVVAGIVLLVAMALMVPTRHRWRFAAVTAGFAVLATGCTSALHTELRPLPGPAKVVSAHAGLATSMDQIRAARWIRDHSGPDDLVMTNRHCTTTQDPTTHCDSRHWVVTAFSERQVLVEGWTATPMAAKLGPNGRDSITVNYWKPDLLSLNDGFIAAPTSEAAAKLRAMGVRWVYVDHSRPYATTLEPYAKLRYSNADVDVYEMERS
jgi:hypothetical protein